jgi:SAM-dependent methyltransferase
VQPNAVADVLRQCHADYLTTGVKALQGLDAQSLDYCFSNAVLEHIPRAEFTELARQLRRVLKPGGVCVHRVDLKDHLGGGLNNLRFSEERWEGSLFRGAGFYTNRLRFPEILRIFAQAGFHCSTPRVLRWDRLPIPRDRLDPAFQGFSDEDLRVSGFDVVLRIPADPA